MLTKRDEYHFYGGNAIKRIAIEGKPYPTRSAKLVLLGEDEAYIQEAAAERAYIGDRVSTFYEDIVLRIPTLRRGGFPWSEWCWRSVQYLDTRGSPFESKFGRFIDKDKVEGFGGELPTYPFAVWREPTGAPYDEEMLDEGEELQHEHDELVDEQSHFQPGTPEWNRLQEQIDEKVRQMSVIRDEVVSRIAAVNRREEELLSDISDAVIDASHNCGDSVEAYQAAVYGTKTSKGLGELLFEDLVEYEQTRAGAVRSAEQEWAERYSELESQRWSALESEDRTHEDNVSEIESKYDGEPPEDIDYTEWMRRKNLELWDEDVRHVRAIETCNRQWQKDVGEARRNRDAATYGAWQTFIEDSRERWLSHIAEVNELRKNVEDDISEENAKRNRIVSSLAARLRNSLSWENAGIRYASALAEIYDKRREMYIDCSCIDYYLKKCPVPSNYKLGFVAHAHSSDATIRMYADLEMRRCVELGTTTLYRDAFEITYSGGATVSYEEHAADDVFYRRIAYTYSYISSNGESHTDVETYSSTRFSIYFGRRWEVEEDMVSAIYATVAVMRNETTYRDRNGFGPASPYYERKNNHTYGYLRVALVNQGVQNPTYLAQLDKIDDDLADAIAEIDKELADGREDIENEYLKAIDKADADLEGEKKEAEQERRKSQLSAYDDFMEAANPLVKACNSDLQEIDDDEDIDDAAKHRAAQERISQFWDDMDGLYVALATKLRSADEAYQQAVDEASARRNTAYKKAEKDKSDALERLTEQVDAVARKEALRQGAQAAKDEVFAQARRDGVTLRPEARCKWSFDARAIDSDALTMPAIGNRGPFDDFVYCSHNSSVFLYPGIAPDSTTVEGPLIHIDVVYEPKSETGMDFKDYAQEAKDGYGNPRSYYPVEPFDYHSSIDPIQP